MADPPGDLAGSRLPADLARLLHDLRGPLNSAVMHAQMLRRLVGDDESAADSLRLLLEQLVRLGDMLSAAFAVAALETGAVRRVDLRAVAASAAEREGL
ncbi:MAG TPA: histidine kinase dimerization/phospho-acceptor domain-containing protein, partial [Methylomirabilota bacterium]|nr:histidine kinase dimerization/phospho-acceptor domain-containing protein [Methylomirabilota bacterium]